MRIFCVKIQGAFEGVVIMLISTNHSSNINSGIPSQFVSAAPIGIYPYGMDAVPRYFCYRCANLFFLEIADFWFYKCYFDHILIY